jgi:hypothetical protein
MIYRIKKLPYITLEGIRWRPPIVTRLSTSRQKPLYAKMSPFGNTRRARIKNEALVEDGIQYAKNRLMQDTIPHARLMDMAPLRVANIEILVQIVPVRFGNKLLMQLPDIVFQPELETGHISLLPLAPFELFPCGEKICYTGNIMKKISSTITPPRRKR